MNFYVDAMNRLNYDHYAGLEYQTEVLLLSRRIRFEGMDIIYDNSSENGNFGGHTKVQFNGRGQFRGVLAYHMGQQNVMARYPFHTQIYKHVSINTLNK